jgi:hypothetical protein
MLAWLSHVARMCKNLLVMLVDSGPTKTPMNLVDRLTSLQAWRHRDPLEWLNAVSHTATKPMPIIPTQSLRERELRVTHFRPQFRDKPRALRNLESSPYQQSYRRLRAWVQGKSLEEC